jgi:splicing factor U2AF subunit
MIPHLYIPLAPGADGVPVDDTEHFEEFYEEILEEFQKFGELEQLNIVENLGDHMFGNVYVKFQQEDSAEACLKAMTGRYYAGRLVAPEFSPVTDFREARCRQYDEGVCDRGGYCNFMHMKHVPRHLRRLFRPSKRRERDRERRRSRSRSRDRGRDRDRDRDRKDSGRDVSVKDEKDSVARSGSAERRAKIAEWNRAKEAPSGGPEGAV